MDDDERQFGDSDTQHDMWEDRRRSRRRSCECGNDLPGHCPGPENCQYASRDDADGSDG
jgi:hypothetical protein